MHAWLVPWLLRARCENAKGALSQSAHSVCARLTPHAHLSMMYSVIVIGTLLLVLDKANVVSTMSSGPEQRKP